MTGRPRPSSGALSPEWRDISRHSTRNAPLDEVLAALADPTRRQLLEALGRRPASSATMLANEVPVSRQAVVKHLGVLRESRLVASRQAGKEVLFSVRPEQLVATASWMTELAATWQERLQLLKQQAEQ
jgi:DNA-binding transcriptional ArsR family regulator